MFNCVLVVRWFYVCTCIGRGISYLLLFIPFDLHIFLLYKYNLDRPLPIKIYSFYELLH